MGRVAMTSLLTLDEAIATLRDTRDQTWKQTRLGCGADSYLAWCKLNRNAPRTLDQKERDLAVLCRRYGDRDVSEIAAEEILDTLVNFSEGQRTRARSHFNDFMRWAVLWGHRDDNPVDKLPRIRRKTQTHIDTFTDAECELLAQQVELRDRALVLLLLETGVRKEEACHLKVQDVDLDSRRLTVKRGKGGKARVIPYGPRLAQALAELILLDGLKPSDHLWYGVLANQYGERIMRRTPVGPGSFHRWWERMVEHAGVPYRKPHTTRHTYATRWLRDGGSLHALSRALGHASIRTTIDEYAHLGTDDIAAELDRVLAARAEREG